MTAATRPATSAGSSCRTWWRRSARCYGMAANLSAVSYLGLTSGAAHLIEAFGSDALKAEMMARMYAGSGPGRWRSPSRRRAAA